MENKVIVIESDELNDLAKSLIVGTNGTSDEFCTLYVYDKYATFKLKNNDHLFYITDELIFKAIMSYCKRRTNPEIVTGLELEIVDTFIIYEENIYMAVSALNKILVNSNYLAEKRKHVAQDFILISNNVNGLIVPFNDVLFHPSEYLKHTEDIIDELKDSLVSKARVPLEQVYYGETDPHGYGDKLINGSWLDSRPLNRNINSFNYTVNKDGLEGRLQGIENMLFIINDTLIRNYRPFPNTTSSFQNLNEFNPNVNYDTMTQEQILAQQAQYGINGYRQQRSMYTPPNSGYQKGTFRPKSTIKENGIMDNENHLAQYGKIQRKIILFDTMDDDGLMEKMEDLDKRIKDARERIKKFHTKR